MARASSLALFRRCLRAARRCPERDQRLMMTYYTINSWRDGASLRDERAIRRQLADALDQVERMEYLLASKAAAVGSPSAASAALTAPAASAASPPARAVAAAPKAAAAASAVDLDDWLAKHELTRYRAAILEQAAEVRERACARARLGARGLARRVTRRPLYFSQLADLREITPPDLDDFIARHRVPPLAARRLTRALAAAGAPVGDAVRPP